jgi:NADH:ubiquinone reductase (H+-translocating)
MARILVLGAGFAGLWSAVGAARALDEFEIGADEIKVTVVNRDIWHAIRVRNYEADLRKLRVPLDGVLDPIGVEWIAGEVVEIDLACRQVACMIRGTRDLLIGSSLLLAANWSAARSPDSLSTPSMSIFTRVVRGSTLT